jgi:hypothetical protein
LRAAAAHEEDRAALSSSKHSIQRRTPANYLLTGLLKTPSGESWYGDGQKQYRTKPAKGRRRYLRKDVLEDAVVRRMLDDMQSQAFIRQLVTEAQRYASVQPGDQTPRLRKQLKELNQRLSRMMDFTASLKDPGPALRKIDELEQQRKTLLEEIARLEKENGFNAQLAHITEPSVRQVLNGVVAEMRSMDHEALKDMLGSLAEKVVLDPVGLSCRIHYRIGIEGRNKLASPRGFGVSSLRTN